jgi:large subunit ribosomal protein L10
VPTKEKIESVETLKSRLDGVKTAVLTEYRGLSVQQLSDLRKQLKSASAEYAVVKNRLARLAIRGSSLEGLAPHLTGPTGIVIGRRDPVAVAKALSGFAKVNTALQIKAGVVEGQFLPPNEIKALADLPSGDQLRGQLLGAVQGPMARLAGVLTAPLRELVYVLETRGKGAQAS